MTVNISKPAINVREKLNELDKPTGIAGEAMLRAETPQEQFNLIGAGRRNLVINGGFIVSQRGNYTSATSITNNNYYLDRWNMDFQGINAVIENNTADLPNGNTVKTAKIRATGSGTGYMQIRQKMEVESWMDNQTITMSAWVRSNTAYPRLRLESGSGVTGNNLDGSDIYSGSGEWEKLTFTTLLKDGLTGFTIGVIFWNGSTVAVANNDYMEIAQVQLELGKVATPFEHRSYGEELALCQRYFNVFPKAALSGGGASAISMWTGNSTSASTRVSVSGPVMRVRPTATLYGTSADSGTTPNIGSDGTYGIYTSSFHSAPTVSISETTSDPSFRISANSSGFLAKGAAGFYFYSNLTRLGDSNWCGVTLDAEL